MRFGLSILKSAVPEWTPFYVNYEMLERLVSPYVLLTKVYVRTTSEKEALMVTNFTNEELAEIKKFKRYFKKLLFYELKKVEIFFMAKLNEQLKKWNLIQVNVAIVKSGLENKQYAKHKFIIKEAFLSFYKELRLLDEYLKINFEAFRKILKKFHKYTIAVFQSDLTTLFELYVEKSNIHMQRMRLCKMTEYVETEYLQVFYKKFNRKVGINELRKINQGKMMSQSEIGFFGFFFGFMIFLIILIITLIVNGGFSVDATGLKNEFPLFRGFSLLVMYIWLLGWNVYGWTAFNINYKMILNFNYHYSRFIEVWHRAAFFSTLFLVSFLWYMIIIAAPESSLGQGLSAVIPKEYIAIFPWGIFLLYFFFPLGSWFNGEGRLFTMRLIKESLLCVFYPVTFRMIWATDQLISFATPVKDFIYFVCYYSQKAQGNDIAICQDQNRFGLAEFIVAFVPLLMRMIQFTREAYARRSIKNIYFLLTLESAFASLVTVFSYLIIIRETETMIILWVVFALLSTILSYVLDLGYDWGFLEKGSRHKFLRNVLSYHKVWLYYFAMGINLVLRFAWVCTISPGIIYLILQPELLIFLVSFLEILRRSIWNFLKIENAHIRNCGEFKAVDGVQLPFDNVNFQVEEKVLIKEKLRKFQMNLLHEGNINSNSIDSKPTFGGLTARSIVNDMTIDPKIYATLGYNDKIFRNHDSNQIDNFFEVEESNEPSEPPLRLDSDAEYSKDDLMKLKSDELPLKLWEVEIKKTLDFVKQRIHNFSVNMPPLVFSSNFEGENSPKAAENLVNNFSSVGVNNFSGTNGYVSPVGVNNSQKGPNETAINGQNKQIPHKKTRRQLQLQILEKEEEDLLSLEESKQASIIGAETGYNTRSNSNANLIPFKMGMNVSPKVHPAPASSPQNLIASLKNLPLDSRTGSPPIMTANEQGKKETKTMPAVGMTSPGMTSNEVDGRAQKKEVNNVESYNDRIAREVEMLIEGEESVPIKTIANVK